MQMEEIKNAYIVFGDWDMIIEIEVDSAEKLGEFILEKIRTIHDVKLTSSLIVAR